MSTILYAERPVGRRGWLILAAACVVGFVVVFLAADGIHDWTVLILATFLVIVIGGPCAVLLASKNRYGSVVLTADRLKVGRESIAVADLWPRTFVTELDPATPSPLSRLRNSTGAVKDDQGRLVAAQGRLAGGAWDVPLGSDFVWVTVCGEPVVVTTNNRPAFVKALQEALDQTPPSQQARA